MTREEEIRQAAEEYSGLPKYQDPFILGAKWADKHQKNPWMDVKTEEPKKNQDVFAHIPNLCGGEYCKLIYLGNYRWSQDEGEYTTEFYNTAVLWMPIPSLPKGGEV